MIPDTIPVFLNGTPVTVPAGSTLAQVVELHDAELGRALRNGGAIAHDGRGIVADASATVSAGNIFRVFRSARTAGAAGDS